MISNGDFTRDIDFQEHVQNIFQRTIDAHTRYQKPACYNAIFIQPFAFDMRVVENTTSIANEPKVFLMKNLYTDVYNTIYPGIDVASIIDKEVVLLNGVEFTTEVAGWGNTHETRSNNAGIRFNSAIRSYLYRSSISYNILPITDLVLTFADGTSLTLPWLASYTTGLADVQKCAAVTTSSSTTIKSKFVERHCSASSRNPAHASRYSPGGENEATFITNTFETSAIEEFFVLIV